MLVKTFQRAQWGLTQRMSGAFAKKKKEKQPQQEYEMEIGGKSELTQKSDYFAQIGGGKKEVDEETDVVMDPKLYRRSSQLYEKFLVTQERPMLTKDGYIFELGVILNRMPIFLPHNNRIYQNFVNRHTLVRKAGLLNSLPEELIDKTQGFPLYQFERTNLDNLVTHRSGNNIFAEGSRYWKLTDPSTTDVKSMQSHPSDQVFFIVKGENGEWRFPTRAVKQKENFDESRKNFIEQLLGNKQALVWWQTIKPIYVTRQDDQTLKRGKGYKTFFYNVYHMSGKYNLDASLWKDTAWVPKAYLGDYFTPDYFQQIIRSAPSII